MRHFSHKIFAALLILSIVYFLWEKPHQVDTLIKVCGFAYTVCFIFFFEVFVGPMSWGDLLNFKYDLYFADMFDGLTILIGSAVIVGTIYFSCVKLLDYEINMFIVATAFLFLVHTGRLYERVGATLSASIIVTTLSALCTSVLFFLLYKISGVTF